MRRRFDAILLDLDGTLVDDASRLRPAVRAALHAAHARGVVVMIATGRSELGTQAALAELGLPGPALVFNGAAVWCQDEQRLIEERVLSNATARRVLEHAARSSDLAISMRRGAKFCAPPRDALEAAAIAGMEGLCVVDGSLPIEYAIRITLLSRRHADSAALAAETERAAAAPVYVTHFPLRHLADHRASPLQVVDVHAPCGGKGEGLRVLEERCGIPAERVVAVGDATNDIPMFERAGLAVAMANGMPAALEAADRVVGDNNSDAIAGLVDELFLSPSQ
jgi:Cof subfamily protein (haloacid dehalogenase superfamily)